MPLRPDDPTSERAPLAPPLSHAEPPALRIYTRAELREIDRLAIEHYGIPILVLIENAAFQLALVASELLPAPSRSALIVCSRGNNGADALALARHLHNAGWNLHLLLSHPPEAFRDPAAIHLHTARQMGIPIHVSTAHSAAIDVPHLLASFATPTLIIDALLGTGAERPIESSTSIAALITAINAARTPTSTAPHTDRPRPIILSIDLPSALDADTGLPLAPEPEPCVRADITVSFLGLKRGFTFPHARPFLGRVIIAPINAPRAIEHQLGTPTTRSAHQSLFESR